jgi:hypothetical protein
MTSTAKKASLAFSFLLISAPAALPLPDRVALLLQRHAGFTGQEIAAARRGERIVRMLETKDPAEVAFAGVIRLPISLEQYVLRVRAGDLYRKNDTILQVGRFGKNPSLDDLQNLHFEDYDLSSQTESETRGTVERRNKQLLLQVIAEYAKKGTMFAGSLGSQPAPINAEREFDPMAKASGYLREYLPAAYEYLLSYPKVARRETDDYFLWKQMTFGFKPLTRVAHVALWEGHQNGIHEAIVLTKQIYANRYFQASFQIDHVIADHSDPIRPSVFLVTFNRGRSDFLEGRFGRAIRPVVRLRTRSTAEKTLDEAKSEMEAEYQNACQAAKSAVALSSERVRK